MMPKCFRVPFQIGIIIAGAAILGLATNHLRKDSMPLVGDWSAEARLAAKSGPGAVISLTEAEKAFSSMSAVFLDARPPEAYNEGHIAGALNLPWQDFDAYYHKLIDYLPDEELIITYCDGESCDLSEELARDLKSFGYQNVRVLVNGWSRWLEAGLPTDEGTF